MIKVVKWLRPYLGFLANSLVKKLINGFVMFCLMMSFSSSATAQEAGFDSDNDENKKLNFLVGEWNTAYTLPAREGEPVTFEGEARIEWSVGGRWLLHEANANFPGRGEVFMTTLMNYSSRKKMYNLYLFDHFGGDAGVFYGNWTSEKNAIVVTAKFEEDDGSESHQKFTLTKVSLQEIWFSRAFSRDGKH